MDKIYSRKKLHIPNIYFGRKMNVQKQKYLKASVILIIAIIAMCVIINSINPIIDKVCVDECKSKATKISNEKATEVMANYAYTDIVTIYRDNNENITMLESNIVVINEITSNIASKIQVGLNEDSESTVYIKLRRFYRNENLFWNRTKYSSKTSNNRNC